jgi:hypothetical protein
VQMPCDVSLIVLEWLDILTLTTSHLRFPVLFMIKRQGQVGSAAAKRSNRAVGHRLYMTVKVLGPASMTSIDRVAPRW